MPLIAVARPADRGTVRNTSRVGAVVLQSALLLASASLAACAPSATTLHIVDHRQAGPDAVYVETFDECFYDADAEGNVDLVLRREHPHSDDASQIVTQIVHVHTFWKSIPGTTVAHDQQINATIRYMILSGAAGASFQGAGSLFCDKRRFDDDLIGTLGQAYLSPRTRLGSGNVLFDRAEIRGEFRAVRDPRRVVRILNEMDERFSLNEPAANHASVVQP